MDTYLKYFIFFQRLCTEYETMTESTRSRGCHFIIQKADILATTGMKATLNFTLKKEWKQICCVNYLKNKSTFDLRSRKAEYSDKLDINFFVIRNKRKWFYNQSLKSIVTRWNPKLLAAALLFLPLTLKNDLIFWVYKQHPEMWPCNWKLLSSTFLWSCSLRCTRWF